MNNISIPSFFLFAVLLVRAASAQSIVNGSFETGDFTGWQVAGIPTVLGAPPTPVDGNFQALINSTGASASGIYANSNSVSAATLNTFLNTTLPSSTNGSPTNGEAIQQTFTTAGSATISFSYSYQSREAPGNGFDETGYVLNGVFHVLADTSTPGQTMAAATGFFAHGIPYQTVTITVGPGTNTLGFVAYNTFNTSAPTGLFIDNIVLTPLTQATLDPQESTDTRATGVDGTNVVGWYDDGGGVQHGFFYNGSTYATLDPQRCV